ncbi:MAG: hypothetical protein WBI07_13200 [Mobilitalea sp.]
MSKFFMYGTDLHELEQLMMLVPNFTPRRSGVIIVKEINKKNEEVNCQGCDFPVYDGYNGITCVCNTDDQVAGVDDYGKMIENYYEDNGSLRLKRRLDDLIRTYDGEIFLNPIHHSRFFTVCRLQNVSIEDRDQVYLAVLFLLTTDNKLWCAAKEHIYLDSFDFKKMHLKGINTDGYAIYQTARTIYTGIEYIKQDEIADRTLIDEQTFKIIINALLLSKYGTALFQVKC